MTKLLKFLFIFVSIWFTFLTFSKDLEILDLELESANEIENEIKAANKADQNKMNHPQNNPPPPSSNLSISKAPPIISSNNINRSNELENAENLFQNKKFKEASEILWKNITLLKKRELLILARCHNQLKEPENTLRATTLIISKDDKSFEAYTLQGLAYVEKLNLKETKELYSQALESFKTAIELNSKYKPAYYGIAAIYEKKKNNYELRTIFQDMIKAIGPLPEFYKKLCEINTKDSSHEQALQTCKTGQQKDPNDSSYSINIGLVYRQQKELGEAKKILLSAAKKFPNEEATQFNLGQIYEDEKNYIDAFEAYNKAAQIDPKSDRALVGLGTTAYQIQKFDIAIGALNKACHLNKKNALHARKANIYMRTNKIKEWGDRFQELADKCNEL